MRKLLLFIMIFSIQSCMPEENLPIQDMGETPGCFIECYCKPGDIFKLAATSVLPVSKEVSIDFMKKMHVTIKADEEEIELLNALYTAPGSDFIHNYVNTTPFNKERVSKLYLKITTEDKKIISGQTIVPDDISIYSYKIKDNEACISFYPSIDPEQNYYIYTIELQKGDSIFKRNVCYFDCDQYISSYLVEKNITEPFIKKAEQIRLNLKRVTKANFDYQLSLNGANSANQSSMTTPVPLKGNLENALGIFTCYTEDEKNITLQ